MCVIKNSLGQSQEMVKSIVKEGDTVIDATAGNGHDTVFLARLVGEGGKVYSFDIQERAIQNTKKKLEEHQLEKRVVLIRDGHQNMDRYAAGNIRAVMFNLGYLPGGDHTIGTRWETTLEAVKKAMDLIMVNGIVSIVIYYGGDSGFEEKEHVMEFLKGIDCRKYTVMKTDFINQINCPPIFVGIEKFK
ncbi:MAG: methyltransferase domain-containing protein [Clostridia bacterium]|nr:methyltransferase domain-containing protein [Clostridia bacterium]